MSWLTSYETTTLLRLIWGSLMSMWRIKEQNRHREEFWKDSILTQWTVPSERPLLVKMEIRARTFSKLLQKQSVVKKKVSCANCLAVSYYIDCLILVGSCFFRIILLNLGNQLFFCYTVLQSYNRGSGKKANVLGFSKVHINSVPLKKIQNWIEFFV